jgi:hypothetical protein
MKHKDEVAFEFCGGGRGASPSPHPSPFKDIGHFYFGSNRTFLFWFDKIGQGIVGLGGFLVILRFIFLKGFLCACQKKWWMTWPDRSFTSWFHRI